MELLFLFNNTTYKGSTHYSVLVLYKNIGYIIYSYYRLHLSYLIID